MFVSWVILQKKRDLRVVGDGGGSFRAKTGPVVHGVF